MPNLPDYTDVGTVATTDQLIADRSGSTVNVTVGGMATQDADSVAITGGDITGITDLAVEDGGTGASTAAAARTALGLAIGTDVQAYDAGLTDLAGLAVTDGNFVVGDGANWVAESGATARTSLGLGSVATLSTIDLTANVTGILPSANGGTGNGFSKLSGATTSEKTYTLPDASSTILTDNAAVTVAQGGTGRASSTAYAVLCGGTTSTAAQQSIAGVGSSGQVLTSNGAGALPTFQAAGGGVWSVLSTQTASTSSTLEFSSGIDGTYDIYRFDFIDLVLSNDGTSFNGRTSTDGGSTFDSGAGNYALIGSAITATAGTFASIGNNSQNTMQLSNDVGNAAGEGVSGHMLLYNPVGTALWKHTEIHVQSISAAGSLITFQSSGTRKATADIDAVQFYPGAGTITSGYIVMSGFTNA